MSGASGLGGGHAPVLVAAADDEVRALLAQRLSTIGPVASATTTAEAVAAGGSVRVAVVVPPLPGAEGAEIIDELRARAPLCPVVAIVDDLDAPLARACAERRQVVLLASAAVQSEILVVAVHAARAGARSVAARLAQAETVLGALEEPVVVQAPSGRVVWANPAAVALLGVAAGTHPPALRKPEGGVVGPDTSPVAEALRTSRRAGPVVLDVVQDDTTSLTLECTALPLVAEGESAPHAVASFWRVLAPAGERPAAVREDAAPAPRRLGGGEALLRLDASGHIVGVEGGAGLVAPASALGRLVADLVLPADHDVVDAALARAAAPGSGVVRAEARLVDAEGGRRHIEIVAGADEPDEGRSVQIRDVTRRRRLAHDVARLAAIVGATGDAIVAETTGGRIAAWNAAAERLYRVPAAEALGELVGDLLPWRTRPDVEALAAQLHAGAPAAGPSRIEVLRTDGSTITLDLNAVALGAPGGGLLEISWVARPVPSAGAPGLAGGPDALGRALLTHSAVPTALCDDDERVIEANPALYRFLGRDAGGLVGRRLAEFLHGADRTPLPASDKRHGRADRRYVRPDASVVWGRLEMTRLVDDAAATACWLAQVIDTTELHLREEALERRVGHDRLTGLANRALLADRVGQALRRANRSGLWVVLVDLDIDAFAELDARLGREASDRLITDIAARLAGGVRASDTVARVGIDEFAVVCEDVADEAGARKLGETMVGLFAEPFRSGEEEIAVAVSCGLVILGPHVGVEEALEYGDAALEVARSQGGGRATVVDRSVPGANLRVVE